MVDIGADEILQKMDTVYQDHYLEVDELKNFIFGENKNENINELGNYLRENEPRKSDFKRELESIFINELAGEIYEIEGKIKENTELNSDEKSLLFIYALLFKPVERNIDLRYLHSQQKFDSTKPIEKIFNGQFLYYIQSVYNRNYNPNKNKSTQNGPEIAALNNQRTPINPNIPSLTPQKIDENERIENEYEGLPKIPPLSIRGEQYVHSYCIKILTRAENNGYLTMAEYESRQRNEFRGNNREFEAYVRYDKMLFAFQKYCEVVNKKHELVIKEAGYHDIDEFSQEMKNFGLFQDLIKEKYPDLEEVLKRLEPYWKEMEENKNKYFEGKSENEIENVGKNFAEFQEFQNKKSEEYGITNEIIESLNNIPNTKEEAENYFKNMDTILRFQCELNIKKGEYGGDTIDNYMNYILGIKTIQGKYQQADFDTLKNYSEDLAQRGNEVNFDRCNKYAAMIDRKGKYSELGKDLENIGIISDVLNDPTGENFPIFEVKDIETEKKLKQERIDETRANIKRIAPEVYWTCTILKGFWNGLVDSTIGVGTSLGAMITGLIGGKEHYQSQLQKKERRDNFFKFNQTTEQKQAIYDPQTGSMNFRRDNTVTTVSSSIAQMLSLIYGGSAVGKGIAKLGTKAGITIGENVVARAGLFGMSFISEVGQSYGEALNSGLDGKGAFFYSMLSASVQGGLELVSPNDILLGKGTGLGKQLINSLCKNEIGIKLAGTYFLKSVGREILEENLQEGLQLAAGNLVMEMVNGIGNSNFEIDRNPKNFLSTAIITTLTTGITTGFSAGKQGLQILNSDQPQLISRISADTELYEEVMDILNKTIEGKFTIPNVSENQLKNLKKTLELINTIQVENDNSNQNIEQPEILNPSEDISQSNSSQVDGIQNDLPIGNEGINGNNENTVVETGNLTEEELNNPDIQKSLGLTMDEIINLKNFLNLGVYIFNKDINKIKGITLTDAEKKIFEGFKNLGLTVDSGIIDDIRTFTEDDIINIKKLEELGVYIDMWDINNLKGLTKIDMENIEELYKNGIKAYTDNIQNFKGLAEVDVRNIIELKKIGLKISGDNIVNVIGLTETEVQNIKTLFETLHIEINIKNITNFKGITETDVENITELNNDYGIEIYDNYIADLIGLSNEDMFNIYRISKRFSPIYISDITYLKGLSDTDVKNMIKLNDLGIGVGVENIPSIKGITLTEQEIENIKNLQKLGVKIYPNDIQKIKGINLGDIPANIKLLIESGIKISSRILLDVINITDIDVNNILELHDYIENESDIIELLGLSESDVVNIKRILGNSGNIYNIRSIINNSDILETESNTNLGGYEYSNEEIRTYQMYTRGAIIENIQQHVQSLVEENRDISAGEIINKVRPSLVILSPNERLQILSTIYQIVDKFNATRNYLDFNNGPYKTPKELLCAIRGLYKSELKGNITDDITVRQHGIGFVFFIGEQRSYQIIHDRSLKNSGERSGGFNTQDSSIDGLEGTLSVVNGRDPGQNKNSYQYGTMWHEGQHNWNIYFMTETNDIEINRAKDEITAYLIDGDHTINEIEQILTKPKSEGGLYQYNLQGEARETHKEKIRELLSYVNDLIELTKDPKTGLKKEKVINMLSDASVDEWEDLHSCIIESVKTHIDKNVSKTKIEGLKQQFLTKIKERAGNNRLITNLIDFWNSMFPDYGIKFEEFRWAGTAKKETVIYNIENCNSIEEIKHVLNDPKYSHIGWGPNNLGGIEVSQIIDEVIAGKQLINNIPTELREIIQEIYSKQMTSENGTQNQTNETENRVNTEEETQQSTEQQENLNEGKTNVERLEELGIKITEESKEKINKMELDYLNLGNQNIDNISTSDFEILVNNSTEFPKYLITAELINNILNTINISQSRLLIEKFSINNDADLFNSILRQIELQAIENLNKENGLIPIYDQLFNELEKLEYNENNIDEFTKTLERYINYISENDRNRLVEAFPNKSEINEILKFLSNETLSDTIIDYHFNDISYNVFLDLKELLNYQVTNGVTIPIEHLKIYRDILNIDNLSIEEKINLHNELKNINVIEMFYNDYTSSRDRMYQEIADSILNKEKLEQFRDSELSEQYGISIYKFDGQEFFALARESGLITNTGKTKGFSFSLVGKDCIGTRGSSHLGKGKPVNAFIYEGLDPQSIMHVFPKDSHTNSQYQPRRNDNNRHNFDQHVNTIMSPTELLKSTQDYNEIFILRNGNDGNQYQSIGEIKPIALYCYDEITPEDIETAKRENVGIMLIKTDAYKKNTVNPEWGRDYIIDKHSYIDSQNKLDNVIGMREEFTSFEHDEELNDIINGK